jgi:2-dehydro-3-deoxygluconokinase
MLRLSAPVGVRLNRTTSLGMVVGGAESNLAVGVAALGYRSAWFSRLPDTPLGQRVAWEIASEQVDVSGVVWAPEGRVGLYFIEFGTPPRPIEVIYDRANSAAAAMKPSDIAWEHLLDTRLIHLTGITPALSQGCLEITREAIERARDRDIIVSFDVNYRARLWQPEEAAATLLPLARRASLVFCNRADARVLFGLDGSPEAILEALLELFHCPYLVLTLGNEGAMGIDAGGRRFFQPALPCDPIVDRIGAGDAFAAGVVVGLLEGSLETGLRYGAAMSAIKLGLHGDFVRTNRAEVLRLIDSAGTELRPAR